MRLFRASRPLPPCSSCGTPTANFKSLRCNLCIAEERFIGHLITCDWHLDQYPDECTCGGIARQRTLNAQPSEAALHSQKGLP